LFIVFWIFAAFSGFLAVKCPDTSILLQWLKFLFAVIAVGLGIAGILGSIEYMTWLWTQINQARYPIILARTLAGVNPAVAGIWERHTDIEVLGMIGPDLRVVWRIRAYPIDVDWSFAQRFIDVSRSYYPHTAPIGRAYEFADAANAERQASAFISRLAELNVVEPGVGNQTAVFKMPWETIAEAFEVEE
jgi:hypothetical protein